MNLIKDLTNRLIEARGTNKAYPCKTYATEEAAEKATSEMAQTVAEYFTQKPLTAPVRSARYVLIQVPGWEGRWVGCIDQCEVMGRANATGGYLGIAKGFFVY